MDFVKSAVESKTIWWILSGIMPILGNAIGFDFTTIIATHKIDIGSIITIIGGVLAIYSRIRATKEIVSFLPVKTTDNVDGDI